MSVYSLTGDMNMAEQVWKTVSVGWNDQEKEWQVYGLCWDSLKGELLFSDHLKKDAIEEAMIYAFDTSCGPARSKMLNIFSKACKHLKTVWAA